MEDLNIQVLQGFKVKARRIAKERAYYICNTDKGCKIIRKSLDSEKHIVFQHEIKEYLWQVGFRNIDRFALSTSNKPYMEFDGNYYIMTDFIGHREADFSDNEDFKKIIEATAKLHKTARDIPFKFEVFKKSENILKLYRKSILDMEAIKKKIGSKRRLSDFDVIFLKNYTYYYEQIRQAHVLLEQTTFSSKRAWAAQHNSICHNLLKEEYILINNSETYITGFSQASVDYQLFDLCNILVRYAKKLPKNPSPIDSLLEIYDHYNPLDREDLDILYPLLKFPSKYVKICSQYYSKNRTWTPNAIINRVENIVKKKDIYEAFIEGEL